MYFFLIKIYLFYIIGPTSVDKSMLKGNKLDQLQLKYSSPFSPSILLLCFSKNLTGQFFFFLLDKK